MVRGSQALNPIHRSHFVALYLPPAPNLHLVGRRYACCCSPAGRLAAHLGRHASSTFGCVIARIVFGPFRFDLNALYCKRTRTILHAWRLTLCTSVGLAAQCIVRRALGMPSHVSFLWGALSTVPAGPAAHAEVIFQRLEKFLFLPCFSSFVVAFAVLLFA